MSLPIFKIVITKLCITLSSLTLLAFQDPKPNENPTPAKKSNHLEGTIHFTNGDSISGKLQDWSKSEISIISPDLLEPVTFSTSKILKISIFDKENSHAIESTLDETILIMNNRDSQKGLNGMIRGSLVDIDAKQIKLKTSYAGQISVLKKFISRMEIDPKKGYLYHGPQSLENWHNNSINRGWKFENKSLISKSVIGNIAKNINLPDQSSISFELSWKQSPFLSLYLYSSDHEKSRPDNYYRIKKQNGSWLLFKYIDGKRVKTTKVLREKKQILRRNFNRRDRVRASNVSNKRHGHYTIYMSKTTGLFHIYSNGIKLITLQDTDPTPEKFGTAIHLVNYARKPVRIKNLRISKWGGHIPKKINDKTFNNLKDEDKPDSDGEHILLKNGDLLFGKINKVENGLIELETKYTPLKLPINRMRSIDITGSIQKEEPLKDPDDIKCWFKDSGWIILKLISIDGKTLTAYHQAIGENKFDINAFKRIDLNIYDAKANSLRKSDIW